MAEQELQRPLPASNALTEPFWEATKQHKLVAQYCDGLRPARLVPARDLPGLLDDGGHRVAGAER